MQTAFVLCAGILLYAAMERKKRSAGALPVAPKLACLSSELLQLPSIPGWRASNVSCFEHSDSKWLVVRYINYRLFESMHREQKGPGRTLNVLVKLRQHSLKEAADHFPLAVETELKEHENRISYGIEDIRVVSTPLGLVCCGATIGYGTHPMKSDAVLCRLDMTGKKLVNMRLCPSPDKSKQQKNWIPVVTEDKQTLIVQYLEPLQTARVLDDLSIESFARGPSVAWNPRPMWGSSNYLDLSALHAAVLDIARARYLAVVHRTFIAGRRKSYQHAFCVFDKDLALLTRSGWFSFSEAKVEFCTGICFTDKTRTHVGIYYTVLDQDPRVAVVLLSMKILNEGAI